MLVRSSKNHHLSHPLRTLSHRPKHNIKKQKNNKKGIRKEGAGIINNLINKLPFELHLPGYNYCGPGTKLYKRLARGDKPINQLDEACKVHDIAYAQNPSLDERHKADLELIEASNKRRRESSSLAERLASLAVNKIMSFKVKHGLGIKHKPRARVGEQAARGGKRRKQQQLALSKVVKGAREAVKRHMEQNSKRLNSSHLLNRPVKNVTDLMRIAVKSAKSIAGGKCIKTPRVIQIPKKGGFLPLLPLLGALGAAGSLIGGFTTAARNIHDLVRKKETGSVGKGMYLAPYKRGMGLYLTPKN